MADRAQIERLAPSFAQREPWEAALDPSTLGNPDDYDGLGAHVARLQRGESPEQVFALLPDAVRTAIAWLDPDRPASNHAILGNVPLLPTAARLTAAQEEEGQSVGRWLTEYEDFASRASPLTPKAFHTAAGLFAGSVAIARRLHLAVGTTTIYPNIYVLYVGPSTIQRKSTALRVVRGLLREARLDPLLLADRLTPEALVLDLGLNLPPTYSQWNTAQRERWLAERRFAGQRGWLLEEASQLFDSFSRDYTEGLLPLVLDLYDSADEGPRRLTMSRGPDTVDRPYISVFGASTFGALHRHLRNESHWHDGLYARFAIVSSSERGAWRFWPAPLGYPPSLCEGLRFLALELLPAPSVRLDTSRDTDRGGGDGQLTREVILTHPLVSSAVQIEPEAWRRWEQYAKATGYDMLSDRSATLPERLHASYGRLGTMMAKVAMILAALDARNLPVVVTVGHMYRAQAIVEEWRRSPHRVQARVHEAQNDEQRDRVLAYLAAEGTEWTTRRELLRCLGCRWADVEKAVRDLVDSGEMEAETRQGVRGRPCGRYRLVL